MPPVPPIHQYGVPRSASNQQHWQDTEAGFPVSRSELPVFSNAFRDIENLYGGGVPRSRSSSPEKRYWRPADQPQQTRRPQIHKHAESSSSMTPLMIHEGRSYRESPAPTRRQHQMPGAGYAAPAAVSPVHDRSPRQISQAGGSPTQRQYETPIASPAMPAETSPAYDQSPPGFVRGDGYGDAEEMQRHAIDPTYDPRSYGGGHVSDDKIYDGMPKFQSRGLAAKPGIDADPSRGVQPNSRDYDSRRMEDSDGRPRGEKSEWLNDQRRSKKRQKWIICIVVTLLVIAGAVGGAVGGVLASRKSHSSGATSTSGSSTSDLYNIHSKEVQALLNDNSLHKVFPGMDYTPLNAQYPACLSNPPDQNNITLDMTMLSQLTPAVRLYGTDCNQTEMVLEAISLLDLNTTLQVWLGVWLGTNQTTNDRQLAQMYTILSTYPASHFAGLIIGNEILFRKDMPLSTLGSILADVRANLTGLGISLPVATSDLGDDWTAELAADSDIVMANVHPFFAGVTPDVAPGWTWDFWQSHDALLATASSSNSSSWPKSIISEVGWPSEGGNDCGTADGSCPSDTAGAVASVDNMNTFMNGWVCQSLANGTTYFWFEGLDEGWKDIFNTENDKWESRWGLMDENRKLKDGINIPDCGGKTVQRAY